MVDIGRYMKNIFKFKDSSENYKENQGEDRKEDQGEDQKEDQK